MTVAVHQLLPSLHVADASGAHTLAARDALRAAGFSSEVFVEHVDAPLAAEARPVEELDAHVVRGQTLLVYQLAVGSTLVDLLMGRGEPLVVNYHNLTPASFFWQWAPDWLGAVETGRQQLHRLVPRVTHAIAVSAFNERDLKAAGYRSTSVVPPFVEVSGGEPDAGASPSEPVTGGARSGARWLFVGKLLPHKAAHDVVKAFACYRRTYDPDATLALVGGHPVASYAEAVRAFAAAAGVGAAVSLAGSVSREELRRHYRAAQVFVCLSDHEGFCFPLLEAMHHGVPVVAFDAGAVAATAGDAAVVLQDKDPALVAAAVRRAVGDAELRDRLVAAGRRRLEVFAPQHTAERFVDAIRTVLARPGVLGASR
ncbi:MAG: glycosyltransferase family 4 protein [Acidimicrobiales bacterium]